MGTLVTLSCMTLTSHLDTIIKSGRIVGTLVTLGFMTLTGCVNTEMKPGRILGALVMLSFMMFTCSINTMVTLVEKKHWKKMGFFLIGIN